MEGSTSRVFRPRESVNLLVLGDQMLLLRRLWVRVSRRDLWGEHVLLKKAFSHEPLKLLLKCPALIGQVSLAFVVGAVLLRPKVRRIILQWSRASDSWLILEGVENSIDREL